jgi:hypothetical protein
MLERYAMKVARTVLRGGSGSNATPLPDHAALVWAVLWARSTAGQAPVPQLTALGLTLTIFSHLSTL